MKQIHVLYTCQVILKYRNINDVFTVVLGHLAQSPVVV
jgi:hypothetical protein